MKSVALTIAGSDPSGGAGLQADLKTFQQHGVYGMSVVTLLTVQNTQRVSAVETLPAELVARQLEAIVHDIPPTVAKTGALGSAATIELLAEQARGFGFPLVIDPVMVSKHGDALLDADAVVALRRKLLQRAFLVTPNMPEAAALAEMEVRDVAEMEKAAQVMWAVGIPNVLIKGGQLPGQAVDVLMTEGELHRFAAPRVETPHTHGSGCVFSAAITARLARGEDVLKAVAGAKAFVTAAIQAAPGFGHGRGPLGLDVDVADG
jgi:hydroxymethylpyrimidine/phosphomethylpyrimidine kinase